jgi:hypothetical protein
MLLLRTSDRCHANSHVRLIGGAEGRGLSAHLRDIEDIAALAVVTRVASDQGSRQTAGLKALIEDATHKHGMLDIVSVMPQPAQCCRPPPIKRVIGWPKLWWSFEFCWSKASDPGGYSCFDQVYLVWPSDCGDDGVDAAECVLEVVGIVVVYDTDLETALGECGLGLDRC